MAYHHVELNTGGSGVINGLKSQGTEHWWQRCDERLAGWMLCTSKPIGGIKIARRFGIMGLESVIHELYPC